MLIIGKMSNEEYNTIYAEILKQAEKRKTDLNLDYFGEFSDSDSFTRDIYNFDNYDRIMFI